MKKPCLILTVGPSGSGKTTWAKMFIDDNPNFINLNRDVIRAEYMANGNERKYKYTKQKEKLVTELQLNMARAAVASGKGVLVSDTNLNVGTRETWREFAMEMGLQVEVKEFDELPHILVARNLLRTDSRPLDVVYRMARSMREYMGKPIYDKSEQKVGMIGWRAVKPHAVVFDIDGTLAHHDGKRSPYAFSEAIDDRPDDYLIDVLRMHKKDGFQIIILTGRESDPSGVSEVTIDWLKKHDVDFDFIWCRKHGDHRSDAIVKEELFFDHIADDFSVHCVYDDRDQVVHMWRSIGVTCFQVAYGVF